MPVQPNRRRFRFAATPMLAVLIACGDPSTAPTHARGTWTVRSVEAFPTPTPERADTTTVIVMTGTVTLLRYGEIRGLSSTPPEPVADVEFTSSFTAVEYRAPAGDRRCSGAPLACWEEFGATPVEVLEQVESAKAAYDSWSTELLYVNVPVSLRGAAGYYSGDLSFDPRRAFVYDSVHPRVLEMRRHD